MRNIVKNKRGDASEYITFIIIIFFLAVSFLIMAFVLNIFSDTISTTALNQSDAAETIVNRLDKLPTNAIQYGFVTIFAFLIIGMMASAFLIRIHPVFIFIYIIFLAVSIFVSFPLANTYQKLMAVDVLSEIAAQQTMTNWIMEHFATIILGVGALSMIITFGKLLGSPRSSGGSSDIG